MFATHKYQLRILDQIGGPHRSTQTWNLDGTTISLSKYLPHVQSQFERGCLSAASLLVFPGSTYGMTLRRVC